MDKNPTATEKIRKRFSDTYNRRNRAFSKEELESYAEGLSYNWLNEIVRTGLEQNHSLGFSAVVKTAVIMSVLDTMTR